jgi:hypothetical protein
MSPSHLVFLAEKQCNRDLSLLQDYLDSKVGVRLKTKSRPPTYFSTQTIQLQMWECD